MSDLLKIGAILSMIIDHSGRLHGHSFFTVLLGRFAFPVFAYLVAKGALRTRSPHRYMQRLAILAIASQLPYALVMGASDLNVVFVLLSGVALLSVSERSAHPLYLALVPLSLVSSGGPAAVLLIYSFGRRNWASALLVLAYMSHGLVVFLLGYMITFSIIFAMDAIKPGKRILPWWTFYAAYPAHFLII